MLQPFTVTVAGSERHDGEKPYTYVLNCDNSQVAGDVVIAHHKSKNEDDDVILESVVPGEPPADCGYFWNDLRT